MVYAFLGLGFPLLLIGSEAVLRGGAGLFRALGVPNVFVGLLMVTFAMSAPELSVALQASARGLPDIALGDIVGSTIANTLLVFGLGALLRPMPTPPRVVFRDAGVLIATAIAFVCAAIGGYIARPLGAILVSVWLGYLVLAYLTDLGRPSQLLAAETRAAGRDSEFGGPLGLFLFAVGLVCLYFGASLAIDLSVLVSRFYHLPLVAVALTILSLGTALPELFATLGSAARGHSSSVSGQIIASCVFNILFVFGTATLVRPMSVSPMLTGFDAPIMAVCAVVLFVMMMFGWRLTRLQGLLLLVGYGGYVVSVGLRSGLHL